MSLGSRLREERTAMGQTQTEFAEKCGVKKLAQLRFEKDENLPGGAYLLAAHALGVDIQYVLTGVHASELKHERAYMDRTAAAEAAVDDICHRYALPKTDKLHAALVMIGCAEGVTNGQLGHLVEAIAERLGTRPSVPPSRSFDPERLAPARTNTPTGAIDDMTLWRDCAEGVEIYLKAAKKTLAPHLKVALVAECYAEFRHVGKTAPNNVVTFLRSKAA